MYRVSKNKRTYNRDCIDKYLHYIYDREIKGITVDDRCHRRRAFLLWFLVGNGVYFKLQYLGISLGMPWIRKSSEIREPISFPLLSPLKKKKSPHRDPRHASRPNKITHLSPYTPPPVFVL